MLIAQSRVPRACRAATDPADGMLVVSCVGHSIWVIAQQNPASSRAAATAMIVRRLARASRRVQVRCRRRWRCPRDRDRFGGLAVLAVGERLADRGALAVVPGGLDQQPAGVRGAGLGDRPEPALLPGRCSRTGPARRSSSAARRGRTARSRRPRRTARPRSACRPRAGSATGRPATAHGELGQQRDDLALELRRGGARARRSRRARRAASPAPPATPSVDRLEPVAVTVRPRPPVVEPDRRDAAAACRAGAGSASDPPGPPHARGRDHAAPPPRARAPGPDAACPASSSRTSMLGVAAIGLDPVARRPRDLARRRDDALHTALRELAREPVPRRARPHTRPAPAAAAPRRTRPPR